MAFQTQPAKAYIVAHGAESNAMACPIRDSVGLKGIDEIELVRSCVCVPVCLCARVPGCLCE